MKGATGTALLVNSNKAFCPKYLKSTNQIHNWQPTPSEIIPTATNRISWLCLATHSSFFHFSQKSRPLFFLLPNDYTFLSQKIQISCHYYITSITSCYYLNKKPTAKLFTKQAPLFISFHFSLPTNSNFLSLLYHINHLLLLFKQKNPQQNSLPNEPPYLSHLIQSTFFPAFPCPYTTLKVNQTAPP